MVFGFRREKLYPNMDIPLGAANPAVKQGLSLLPSCPFLGHAASPGPQSWVSVPILCSKRAAGDTDHSEKGPELPHQLPTHVSKCTSGSRGIAIQPRMLL